MYIFASIVNSVDKRPNIWLWNMCVVMSLCRPTTFSTYDKRGGINSAHHLYNKWWSKTNKTKVTQEKTLNGLPVTDNTKFFNNYFNLRVTKHFLTCNRAASFILEHVLFFRQLQSDPCRVLSQLHQYWPSWLDHQTKLNIESDWAFTHDFRCSKWHENLYLKAWEFF